MELEVMGYFFGMLLLAIFVASCLIGGLFYGYSYLRAKANKISVDKAIVDSLGDLTKPKQ